MFTLCALYVAQGIPFGFVTITFASWLARPEHGLTTEQIGPVLAVATLPWSFKFVWGPLMDRYTIPGAGRRRPWIIFAQASAVVVLGSMLLWSDLPSMVSPRPSDTSGLQNWLYFLVPGPLGAIILVANIFVSMQDVAVDALAVDLLKEEERGIANGLMYGSSYLGTAIGGAGLGWIVAKFGIQAGLLGQASLLGIIVLLPILVRERREQSSADHVADSDQEAAIQTTSDARDSQHDSTDLIDTDTHKPTVSDLLRAFSIRATILGAVVAVGVKIGIGVLTAVLVDYLLKGGNWTQEDYTAVTGGWAVMLGLSGAALGGFLADRIGAKPVIFSVSMLLGAQWIACGVIPNAIDSKTMMTGLLISQEFLFAVLSVGLFSMFMTISWPRVAATQFTAYMALMNLSTTIGSYISGALSTKLSVPQILIVAGILQALMVIPVLRIELKQTRRVLGES